MKTVTVDTDDGLSLEGRWDAPSTPPVAAILLCHPHPLQGGTMTAPLMNVMAAALTDAGAAVLRFNFRGVGGSEGRWGGGLAEIYDVAAAAEMLADTQPGVPFGVAGWSFGAVMSLHWQARTRSRVPWVGVAAPLRMTGGSGLPDPAALAPARRMFIIGDRDQFVGAPELSGYATDAGARIEILQGSDHFFHFRERQVASLVATHLLGGAPVESEQP